MNPQAERRVGSITYSHSFTSLTVAHGSIPAGTKGRGSRAPRPLLS
jgi:hypothetical protein